MTYEELLDKWLCKLGRPCTAGEIVHDLRQLEQVVRCKDCKHKPSGSGVNHDIEFPDEICPCQCEDYWYSWMPKDDFFCAWGERREDG